MWDDVDPKWTPLNGNLAWHDVSCLIQHTKYKIWQSKSSTTVHLVEVHRW